MPTTRATSTSTPRAAGGRRSATSTDSSSVDADIRAAEDRANANAEAAFKRTTSDAGFVGLGVAPQPPKPSHRAVTRAADSGHVYSSPADMKARQGDYEGGQQVWRRDDANKQVEVKPGSGERAEPVSAEGVPDLPAIERHNKETADTAIATRINEGMNPANAARVDPATIRTPLDGNYANVIEGAVADSDQEKSTEDTPGTEEGKE